MIPEPGVARAYFRAIPPHAQVATRRAMLVAALGDPDEAEAVWRGAARHVLPLPDIAPTLIRLCTPQGAI